MGGTYTIYAYFNAQQIQGVLNAIVMLVGSSTVDGDYLTLIRVASMIGIFLAVTLGFVKARGEEAAQYLLMVAIFYTTLFVPRVNVTIEEKSGSGGAPVVVANVPLGLAFFASTTSHIGYWFTESMETFFSLPSTELNLSQHGLMGGARSLREAQSASISDPVLAQDMVNFMRDCINPELVTTPLALTNLMASTTIWTDLAALVNPGRMVTMTASASGAEGCDTAYTYLGLKLTGAIAGQMSIISRIISPNLSPAAANASLASLLPAAEGLIMTASASAADALKQRMMINVMNDTSATMGQVLNDPAAIQSALGNSIAASSANSSYRVMARMAQDTLPMVRNAIELVILGIFPIVLILVIIAGSKGGAVMRSYVLTMLWVQLWAPLYAIVNYVATMAHANRATAALGGIDGLAIQNAAAFMTTSLSAEAVTGILTISVPMIAYAIVKGGEVAMSSVVSGMMGGATSAAQTAGTQVASGNIQMGNTSWGNAQHNNASSNGNNEGFKYSSPSMAKIEGADAGYTVRTDGSITGIKANTSDAGGALVGKSGVTASNAEGSGVKSELGDGVKAGLTRSTGGGYDFSEGARVASAFAQALKTDFGGTRRAMETDAAGIGRGSTIAAGATDSSAALDSGGINSSLGVKGSLGGKVNVGKSDTVEAATTSTGAAPSATTAAVVKDAAATAKKFTERESANRQLSLGGSLGGEAGTGMVVSSIDSRQNAANTSSSAEQKKDATKGFQIAEAAMASVLGSNATTGEKSAARAILGSIAERIDSQYGTGLAYNYSTNASRGNDRKASAGVEQSNPYWGEAAAQAVAGLGNGDPDRGVRAHKENPSLLPSVTGGAVAAAVASVAPKGSAAQGPDGSIAPPQSVDGHRAESQKAVEDRNATNSSTARAQAHAYVSHAVQSQHATPGATPDFGEAKAAYNATNGRVETGKGAVEGAVTFASGVERLAAEIHKGDRGVGSAAGRAYLGAAGQALGLEHYSGEQKERLAALAATDPKVAEVIDRVGRTGTVLPGDIETVGRSATGHAFAQKMEQLNNNVSAYVDKYLN